MKNTLYFALVVMVLLLAACGASNDEQSQKEQGQKNQETNEFKTSEVSKEAGNTISPDLTSGLDKVLVSLEKLKTTVENSPSETKKIQSTGKMVAENWDQIEKQVEETNPEEYNNIESSLYPLFDEIKKDSPDVVKLKQLIDESIPKVEKFKKSLGS
ncbi:hypothetical protein [Virgibacillus ndiopensis]|uniref:hypothetical protein n=1 Tax=Virgibacillus ndiopensis TaxID=2004408 RepID=UPI000C0695CC|nr:hypothetical protein [Virgibacillus ndiopensis]